MKTTTDPGTYGIHARSELTLTEERRMSEMLEDGFDLHEIAERYDVPRATARQAIERYRAGRKEQHDGLA